VIVIICPGIHPPELTQEFVAGLGETIATQPHLQQLDLWVLPDQVAPYGPDLIHDFVTQRWQAKSLSDAPTVWIGFSAGVMGAVTAARRWQREGGSVRGLIAIDGWGVPLGDRFPRFRLGHDRFTAQSCEWLGNSDGYFYCDPAVGHLDLWRSPQQATGQWQPGSAYSSASHWSSSPLKHTQSLTAAELLSLLLLHLTA